MNTVLVKLHLAVNHNAQNKAQLITIFTHCILDYPMVHSHLAPRFHQSSVQHSSCTSQSLLHLYRSLIRSKLDYGAVVYGSARKSYLRMLVRGYHTAVFISARISSPSVYNCPRRSRGQLLTEGLISGRYENSRVITSLSYDRRISVTLLNGRSSKLTTFNHNDDN